MNPNYFDMKEMSEYLDILKFAKKTNTDITTELLMTFISSKKKKEKDLEKICFDK